MCEGINVIERVSTDLGKGYISEFMLAETCPEHGSVGVAVGAVFAADGSVVRTFEPIPTDTDEDGRVRFLNTVSVLNEDMTLMVSVMSDIDSL